MAAPPCTLLHEAAPGHVGRVIAREHKGARANFPGLTNKQVTRLATDGAIAVEHLVLRQRRGKGHRKFHIAAVAAAFVRARLLNILLSHSRYLQVVGWLIVKRMQFSRT